MIVSVFERPDGSVRVLYPNPRHQRLGESDAAFVARMRQHAVQQDPTLAGLPAVDLDQSRLPIARTLPGPNGARHDARAAWRLAGDRVVIDPAAIREIRREDRDA